MRKDPAIENRAVVWWLRVVAAFVVATLVVGGATRITDSGLSIVEWEPLLGVLPPLSHDAWIAAFEAYRQIPEYQIVNRGMSLEAFQFIYWWEWTHRLIARTIGLVFVVPLGVFWIRGMLPGWFKPWALLLLALGGLQGAIGWWMVSSGLAGSDRVDVSPYRLAIHLTLACIILALTVALSVRVAGRARVDRAPRGLVVAAAVLPFAILIQIALGGLVAGIDAGYASNTWPLMLGALVPDGLLALSPAWLNVFENPITVQFNHRMFAYAVVALVLWQLFAAARARVGRVGALALAAVVLLQTILGIALVVLEVPPVTAGVHQSMAAVFLWIAVWQATRLAAAPAPAADASFATRTA
jgi:cytochrome c oxidase assembly protein subunit 15